MWTANRQTRWGDWFLAYSLIFDHLQSRDMIVHVPERGASEHHQWLNLCQLRPWLSTIRLDSRSEVIIASRSPSRSGSQRRGNWALMRSVCHLTSWCYQTPNRVEFSLVSDTDCVSPGFLYQRSDPISIFFREDIRWHGQQLHVETS